MSTRYRLVPFDNERDPVKVLEDVLLKSMPKDTWGGAGICDIRVEPAVCALVHFRRQGCKALLVQSGITDPDFLDEHAAFYAKQHRDVVRKCVRVHAFTLESVDESDEDARVIDFLDRSQSVSSSYLGFITLRPLRHARIGASILKPGLPGVTARDDFPVHIAGNTFCVNGTPFLQQDSAVGACAQASIWMALRTMRQRFGNAAYSPAELTIAATKYFTSDRVFPGRAGLEVSQMLEAIRFAGHDPLHLDLREIESNPNRAREVINRAGPYLESGLPVILALQHKRRGHAVVAIGRNAEAVPAVEAVDPTLRGTEDWISGLIVQNDALGPYQVLQDLLGPANPELRYELWHADSLIVPLPDAVFTTAAEARQLAQKALQKASILFTADESRDPGFLEGPTVEMALRTYLCRRHTFRRWAKNAPELSHVVRGAFRTAELPPLIWVVELHIAEMYDPIGRSPSRCGEVILDASADTLHGDGLIAIRLSGRMFPELGIENSLLLVEGESLKFVTTEMGDLGQALWEPWRDSEDV